MTPLTPEQIAALNPGIRRTVLKLREWGYDPEPPVLHQDPEPVPSRVAAIVYIALGLAVAIFCGAFVMKENWWGSIPAGLLACVFLTAAYLRKV